VWSVRSGTRSFIDSDLVVTPNFLQAHAQSLVQGCLLQGSERVFTYGQVINTCNFDNPTSEPQADGFSAAYFTTGNVAIARHWLEKLGSLTPFSTLWLGRPGTGCPAETARLETD